MFIFQLHGCFVWERVVKDSKGRDVIETAWNRGKLEREKLLAVALANKENHQTASTTKVDQIKESATSNVTTNNDVCKQNKLDDSPSKRQSNSCLPPIEGLPPP